jgi:hypothetical protein
MGAFTNPQVIDLTLASADSMDLWHYPDFRDMKDLARSTAIAAPAQPGLGPAGSRLERRAAV